jgi:putative ABC transport system permease protein
MWRDVRFACRVLASRPVFTFVAALSLALGIGANSAIFSLIDAQWFRPIAVPAAGEIVRVFAVTDQDRESFFSFPEFLDLKQQAPALRELMAIGGRGATMIEGDSRPLVRLNLVSANFFTGLGVTAGLGRVFTPQDEAAPDGPLMVVLGYNFWQRHYGGDRGIVGRQIRIQRGHEELVTVLGVLPRTFPELDAGNDRDLWFSKQAWARLGDTAELEARGGRWFRVVGRLASGASVRTANAQIEAIALRMEHDWPATNHGRHARCISDFHYRLEQAGTIGFAVLAIVLLVVAISSVNVANLLLSRAGVRAREMAVRMALGADRRRLIGQLMLENGLLGVLGLVLGVAVGAALIAILPSLLLAPPGFESHIDFRLDSRVLWFTLLVSLATVALFGLAPALTTTRLALVQALKGESALSGGGRRWPLRQWLVVAQVALSMTLLACSAVLIKSFANTRTTDLGFARNQILLVWLAANDAKPSLYRQIVSQFEGLPGVQRVAVAVRAPLSLSSNGMAQRVVFPQRPETAAAPVEIKYNSVSASFFQTMGTALVRGRGFEPRDETPGANSVVINESMAQRYWPQEDPLGKTIELGRKRAPRIVIGIARNAPINSIGELPEPYLYLPYWANFEQEATFLVETSGPAAALAEASRQALKSVDARLNPLTITTQGELIRFSALRFQLTAELVGALGLLGLILTAVGLYGVVSYGVSQRTRDFGIRMALGARRLDTLGLVLREVAMLGAMGIVIGLPVALGATRLLSSQLFGVDPWDVAAFAVAAMLLLVVVLGAGFIPARRATTVDPASALRST